MSSCRCGTSVLSTWPSDAASLTSCAIGACLRVSSFLFNAHATRRTCRTRRAVALLSTHTASWPLSRANVTCTLLCRQRKCGSSRTKEDYKYMRLAAVHGRGHQYVVPLKKRVHGVSTAFVIGMTWRVCARQMKANSASRAAVAGAHSSLVCSCCTRALQLRRAARNSIQTELWMCETGESYLTTICSLNALVEGRGGKRAHVTARASL